MVSILSQIVEFRNGESGLHVEPVSYTHLRYLTAPDGQSAILEASSHNPDIVLLDLGLPDIDGVEIIKKIRTWSNMPIIVISARSEDTDKIDEMCIRDRSRCSLEYFFFTGGGRRLFFV